MNLILIKVVLLSLACTLVCEAEEKPNRAKPTGVPSAQAGNLKSPTKKDDFRFDGKDYAYWLDAMKSNNDALRASAANALARFGPRAKSAAPILRDALANSAPIVWIQAYVALECVGEDTRKLVPVVIASLKKLDGRGRKEVYESIQKKSDLPMQAFVPVLIRAFEEFPDDRIEIADTLGQFGPLAKAAVECLIPALEDSNPALRRAAADALDRIREKKEWYTSALAVRLAWCATKNGQTCKCTISEGSAATARN